MNNTVRHFSVMTLFTLLLACGEPNQRLDEHVFYEGPQFRLKVVRYYRNIPFNYLGETAVVMCQSGNTVNYSGPDPQDAGWRTLGEVNTQGGKDAREVALSATDDYQVIDDYTLVGKRDVFNISFDGCGQFINWDPTRLPQTMIDAVGKPESCGPKGPRDCRYYDFEEDRKPLYEQMRVSGKGQVGFSVKTPTFRGVRSLRVHTRNNGVLWHVDTVGLGPHRHKLQPDSLRSLPMPLLEKGMENVSLVQWLESALPPDSMIIWPDARTACSEQQSVDGANRDTMCSLIRFNDSEGNNGALTLTLPTDAESTSGQASFHSAVYRFAAGQTKEIESLSALGRQLMSR